MSDPYCIHRGCDRQELLTENKQLTAEVERLREDSERLEWLAKHRAQTLLYPDGFAVMVKWYVYKVCPDLRDAIDEAMGDECRGGE